MIPALPHELFLISVQGALIIGRRETRTTTINIRGALSDHRGSWKPLYHRPGIGLNKQAHQPLLRPVAG